MSTLVTQPTAPTEKIGDDRELIKVGQWYWCDYEQYVRDDAGDYVWEDDPDERGDDPSQRRKTKSVKRLACVTTIGSNYAEVTCVHDGSSSGNRQRRWRVHLDHFDDECVRELEPRTHIHARIAAHQETIKLLVDEVRQLTAGLGIVPASTLAEAQTEAGQALSRAHGTSDIQAHKRALIKAKEDQLPAIFKKIEKEHEELAVWMKADLIPSEAELSLMKGSIAQVEDRIFTVELYAGLVEELKQITKGSAATIDAKVHLFQRRHYMDEECLANYQVGGMEFEDVDGFDKWLKRPENRNRILPHDRSIVSFRVRRHKKDRGIPETLAAFWSMKEDEKLDESTFLYIRNGKQLWRLRTEVDFGERLFPDRENSDLLGDGNLWIDDRGQHPRSQRWVDDAILQYQKDMAKYRAKVAAWEKLSKKEKKERWVEEPGHFHCTEPENLRPHLEPCTPDHIYYDDVMRKIAAAAKEHNRVATVLQGLLDRSPALQPHPPWKLWQPEGFAHAIELVYDDSNALTSGSTVDFKDYCRRLAASIKIGSRVIGQRALFGRREAKRENARAAYLSRSRYHSVEWSFPRDNPGPAAIAEVEKIKGARALFTWERERERTKWIHDPKDPWRKKRDESMLPDKIWVPITQLFNVSAYTPGDYHLFFDDPRTRQAYLKWAPFLLAAEDFHAGARSTTNSRAEINHASDATSTPDDINDGEDEDIE